MKLTNSPNLASLIQWQSEATQYFQQLLAVTNSQHNHYSGQSSPPLYAVMATTRGALHHSVCKAKLNGKLKIPTLHEGG